jgi:formylglycine-generating enzyme required for sulfatase activity
MRFVDNHFGNPDEEGVTGGGAHVGLGELRFASRDILTIARVNASTFELDWSSQSNRYYRLLSTLDLSQGMPSWDVVVSGILGTPPTNSVQVAAPEIGMRSYYRVEEQPPPSVIPELVEVGNPNNVADFNVTTILGNSGAVPYVYSIGKYEVTNAEYVEFLNGVDPNGLNATFLYNSSMSSSSVGGITFTVGNVDGQKYAVKPGFARKPVVFVSYFDAMRFCNWLHNGVQTGGDTENGAYTLLPPLDPSTGAPSNAGTVVRNAGAKFVVPTEDEWYKAAYHQPQAQGGDTDNYWFYPTGGNSVPNANNPPGTAPAANFDSVVGSVTDVGAYTTTEGFYGTFDMAGNVSEWIETRLSSSSSSHVLRGGSWGFRVNVLRPTGPSSANPEFQDFNIGFRISSP